MISSYLDMNWSRTSCYLFEMFTETLPQMLHNASIYITLVLAVQRYIYATRFLLIIISSFTIYLPHIKEPET